MNIVTTLSRVTLSHQSSGIELCIFVYLLAKFQTGPTTLGTTIIPAMILCDSK